MLMQNMQAMQMQMQMQMQNQGGVNVAPVVVSQVDNPQMGFGGGMSTTSVAPAPYTAPPSYAPTAYVPYEPSKPSSGMEDYYGQK